MPSICLDILTPPSMAGNYAFTLVHIHDNYLKWKTCNVCRLWQTLRLTLDLTQIFSNLRHWQSTQWISCNFFVSLALLTNLYQHHYYSVANINYNFLWCDHLLIYVCHIITLHSRNVKYSVKKNTHTLFNVHSNKNNKYI